MFTRVEDTLYKIEAALGALMFALMFGAVTVQVFFRYVLSRPLVWPFELSIYCYVFIVYIGSAMAARTDTHVRFSLIADRLPGRAGLLISALTDLALAVLFAITIKPALGYMGFVSGVRSTALGIPWSWIAGIYPAAMGLIILHLLLRSLANTSEALR